jgi:hypothetical protein
MVDEKFSLKGTVVIDLYGPDGEVKEHREIDNIVTTLGKEGIIDRLLASPSVGVPTHMAIGKSSEEAKVGDTKLKEELDRNAFSTKTRSGAAVTMVGEWAAGDGTGALKEAGLLNASSEGTLFSRIVFEVINKAAEDTLKITWKYTQS